MTILVEPGAGAQSGHPDAAYTEKGAMLASREELFAKADLVAMVHGPGGNPAGAGDVALLRKGMALEKLEEWDRALECYDRVIFLDRSLTVAYLYKGGICNRLERHREALESYEQALRSERQRVGT